ncbi:MAG: histidinol phosphate phosphatase domain-containing protein [Nitrospirota bacterium]
MIDLHTHSLFSDGVLVPAELVRRAMVKGYEAIAITDHADSSNIDFIIPRIVRAAEELSGLMPITVIPGIELTHVPPESIKKLVKEACKLGAKLVVVHGESPVEPVAEGTNRAAIVAGVDILAHPGLITAQDASLAARKGVFLEITARAGHSLTNGHVARAALKAGARLVLDTDAHEPEDLIDDLFAEKVLSGAGLDVKERALTFRNSREIVNRILGG